MSGKRCASKKCRKCGGSLASDAVLTGVTNAAYARLTNALPQVGGCGCSRKRTTTSKGGNSVASGELARAISEYATDMPLMPPTSLLGGKGKGKKAAKKTAGAKKRTAKKGGCGCNSGKKSVPK